MECLEHYNFEKVYHDLLPGKAYDIKPNYCVLFVETLNIAD